MANHRNMRILVIYIKEHFLLYRLIKNKNILNCMSANYIMHPFLVRKRR